jgi:large subunit ribosomal protein L24e
MKRNPRKLRWTKAFRKAAGKEMVVDSTLQFAARRNVPVRYDRDLVAKTLKAMERVSEIRSRRERVFYKKRMAGKREREIAAARKLVEEQSHLLPRMRGSEKRRLAEEQGISVDEVVEEKRVDFKVPAKVFGKVKERTILRKITIDGDEVDAEMDGADGGWGFESDDGSGSDGSRDDDLGDDGFADDTAVDGGMEIDA